MHSRLEVGYNSKLNLDSKRSQIPGNLSNRIPGNGTYQKPTFATNRTLVESLASRFRMCRVLVLGCAGLPCYSCESGKSSRFRQGHDPVPETLPNAVLERRNAML